MLLSMPHPSGAQASSRRKAMFFCPCGHESPVDGDWLIRERPRSVRYVCCLQHDTCAPATRIALILEEKRGMEGRLISALLYDTARQRDHQRGSAPRLHPTQQIGSSSREITECCPRDTASSHRSTSHIIVLMGTTSKYCLVERFFRYPCDSASVPRAGDVPCILRLSGMLLK